MADMTSLLASLLQYGLPAASKTAPSAPADWQGPPQAGQPWDEWTAAQHAAARSDIEQLDGAKQYQALYGTPGMAGVTQYAPAFEELQSVGGLTPEQASLLARYRIMEKGLGPVPTGPRHVEDPEANAAAYWAAKSDEERKALLEAGKTRSYLTNEGQYDSLTRK